MIFLQKIKIKILYWFLKRSKNPPAWVQFLEKANSIKKTKCYQEQPFYLRWLIWLRWMPYAWLRGVWHYLRYYFTDFDKSWSLHDCIGISIGDIQARKMHWVYSAQECMRIMKQSPSPQ